MLECLSVSGIIHTFFFFLEASLQSVFCKIIGNDYWTSKLLVFLIEVFLNIKAK